MTEHVRGDADAPVTVVEYGDYECPYCAAAAPVLRQLVDESDGRVRLVFRNFPIADRHPYALTAALAAEAAGDQGAFWPMHDLLLERQEHLTPKDLLSYAAELGLDVEAFRDTLRAHATADRVAEDVQTAELSGVSGTPTFFVNGRRHYGAYDIATLQKAVKTARARVEVATAPPPPPVTSALLRRRRP